MAIFYITYKNGAKMMTPITSKEEYIKLRNSAKQQATLKKVREGKEEQKRYLVQMNYSCLPKPDGTLKGAQTPSDTVGMDIDHIPADEMPAVKDRILQKKEELGLMMLEESARGKGYHLVFRRHPEMTQEDNLKWASDLLGVEYDAGAKDITRVFFTTTLKELIFLEDALFENDTQGKPSYDTPSATETSNLSSDAKLRLQGKKPQSSNPITWLGHDVQEIIDKMFQKALPCKEKSNRHESSLKLASDLLVLLDGDKKMVEDVLRRQSWVQEIIAERNEDVAQTITSALQRKTKKEGETLTQYISKKMNTAIKALYGKTYYEIKKEEEEEAPLQLPPSGGEDNLDEDLNSEFPPEGGKKRGAPPAPPVIRELISIAPKDFVVPAINSLLPILGTLTSYVRTEDKSNAKTLSTSFFSIIYAPPSSGKSFVERYINLLLRDLFKRDEINEAKDAVFARSQQQKSANDRSEAVPQTSIRIMEAKNSEAEFLEKQRNNQGHHMFTYCSEIDQWRKGIRAAGGNKDDMVRIAWDNGKYGQNFKSCNTFKGKVSLYWNVLIAGTSDQLMAYFNNVTNGLVTRCSFAEIENQQFLAKAPKWGKLSQKDMKVIDAFIERCDRKTYAEPLTYNPKDCYSVSDKDFDEEVPWHYTFRPFEQVSIDWINRTVDKFNEAQCNKARIDSDEARDTFRRRVAERGKRLALLCTQLYGEAMTKQDKELCKKWIMWWMEQDIENILKPFGKKYVTAIQEAVTPSYRGKTILQRMSEEFCAADVQRTAQIMGFRSPAKYIINQWIKAGVVEKFSKDRWRKLQKFQDEKGG